MTAPRRSASGRVLVALLVAGLGVAGCGVSAESTARDLAPAGASDRLLGPGSPSAPPAGAATETLYLVRGQELVAVRRPAAHRQTPALVLADLLTGPTVPEAADGLSTSLALTAPATVVPVEPGLVEVTFPPAPEGSTRSDDVLAFGQVVLTLTSQPGVWAVRFVQDGAALSVPGSDGSLSVAPRTRNDYADLVVRAGSTPRPSGPVPSG